MLTSQVVYPAPTEHRHLVMSYLLELENVKSMIIFEEKVWDHFKVDKGVSHSLVQMCSCFLDTRMNKIVQESMHSTIIKKLGAIRLEDKEHVNLMRMWMNGIECFWHLSKEVRIMLIVGRKEQGGPVIRVLCSITTVGTLQHHHSW